MLITEFIHHAVGLWNCIVRCITKKEIQSHVIPTTEGCNNLYTTDVTNPGFFPTPRKRATFETVPKTKSADTSADIVVYHLCDLLKFLVFTFPFSRITSNRTVVGIAACRPLSATVSAQRRLLGPQRADFGFRKFNSAHMWNSIDRCQ